MTEPLAPPPRKDPQKPTRAAVAPQHARSRAALAMAAATADGVLRLQACAACGAIAYPPRDACPRCLSTELAFREVPEGAQVLAQTLVRTSPEIYFRQRLPWRIGTVRLDCGPVVVAHLHGDVAVPGRARIVARHDRVGNVALVALPESETPHMRDDPLYRELAASPRHRRILVTDGRTATGAAIAKAALQAGATHVFLGVAEAWRGAPEAEALGANERIEIVPLDVSDTQSVERLAGSIGGKVDILVNNAEHVRPGGILARGGVSTLQRELEVNAVGLARLAQAFGPTMRARGADGTSNAVAIVDVLPVHALANWPEFGAFAASAAARLSILQDLRAELRPGGVRVCAVFVGPLEDAWREAVPPPKVGPGQVAAAIVRALEEGIEDSFVGDVAKDLAERWRRDPKLLEREMGR